MSFDVPDDLKFRESHEWVRVDGDTAEIGISDFAQDELGDIVFVELPDAGDEIEEDGEFGVIESIKAVSDMYAPVSGEVVDTNEALFDDPELVNEDPYGDGWMIEVELADEGELDALLDPDTYEAEIE
ncbi:MAG: glycine cleavage system protein GcvH [Halobacteriales archaeon]